MGAWGRAGPTGHGEVTSDNLQLHRVKGLQFCSFWENNFGEIWICVIYLPL